MIIYKIMELVEKSKQVPDGYYMTTETSYKLKKPLSDLKGDCTSIENAIKRIEETVERYKSNRHNSLAFKKYTIIPIIEINCEGNIKNNEE